VVRMGVGSKGSLPPDDNSTKMSTSALPEVQATRRRPRLT
jgi:hypothetical protein